MELLRNTKKKKIQIKIDNKINNLEKCIILKSYALSLTILSGFGVYSAIFYSLSMKSGKKQMRKKMKVTSPI